jgi:signal transduction histidine kinase
VPERGATSVAARTLAAGENTVLVEFTAPRFAAGRPVRFQYRLDGSDVDWSAPSEARSVDFARLAPGSYRLLVRAVEPEGGRASEAAEVAFTILPPVWQRWWFVAAVAAALAAAALALHRARVRRVLAMERVRRQIATDLHDDMGSGLSQVAILSEVARRGATPEAERVLTEVADLARAMRESMGDIVWAVDPRRDRLADLLLRMRQAAFNLLESSGVRVVWNAPAAEDVERVGLAPDVRRHLLLVFKEALTNVARHAEATTVRVDLLVEYGALRLSIADDGRGFDAGRDGEGTGLRSMRRRAEEMGAALEVESRLGAGTVVRLVLPHIRAVVSRRRPA